MFSFAVTDDFIKSLNKLDKSVATDVKAKLEKLAAYENPLIFAKKLQGYKDLFRFRQGDYRIVFQLQCKEILLLLVKHRKDVYEGL
ncbi:type II toxin-antitoxin system RelE/ParE family toxin [Candidatus Peregrinibacteria bacterium]|nr:type II toxin-antitoxin system RelE/ParE family toxin [Candidatus Peregrinibacteria bacterium]